jgi:SAM-dependent methyltransferase
MQSYETSPDFGVLYDAIPAYAAREDAAFYLEEAARGGRSVSVLEIGCGTGRVSLPLARAGHRLTGVDGSPAMLARFREKLAEEPEEVRQRVALVESDAREFSVPGGFDLAIAPFRVLQHLTTTRDHLACFATVRFHLAPGGRFAFDVFNPHYTLLVRDRAAEAEDTPETALPDGRTLRRTARVTRVRWVEQVSDVELIYYVRGGEAEERLVQAFPMRWFTPPELEHLLARTGFAVEAMLGGFDRQPLTDDAPEIVVVARAV